ncbi:uncharacterized protein PFL1_00021 [Pseudozyma flocculosa PF-1]|nr:uncharacterized protein PFL1_00021 [Pseudozyma flocculosa PF-1]EPQ31822.1 hypothetical protein PFL1_00021 [Pseudozyma flocculosa PF-1]
MRDLEDLSWLQIAHGTGGLPREHPFYQGAEEGLNHGPLNQRLADHAHLQFPDAPHQAERMAEGHHNNPTSWVLGQDWDPHGNHYIPYVHQPTEHYGGPSAVEGADSSSSSRQAVAIGHSSDDQALQRSLKRTRPRREGTFTYTYGNGPMYAGVRHILLERLKRQGRLGADAPVEAVDALIPSAQAHASMESIELHRRLRGIFPIVSKDAAKPELIKNIRWYDDVISFHVNREATEALYDQRNPFRVFRAVATPVDGGKKILYIGDFQVPWALA